MRLAQREARHKTVKEREMTMREIPEIVYTHGGKFHADDVFATALLQMLRPDITVRRVMKLPEGFDGFAYDIGWGEFDHHQADAPVRENGVPYAAFGLLWREYGASLLGETEAARLDERFIQPIDLDDNTGCGGAIPEMIADFNPVWDSGVEPDDRFWEAVALARQVLQNRIGFVLSIGRAYQVVKAGLREMEDRILVLEDYCPWKAFAVKSPAKFAVYPSQRGGWSGQCVPEPEGSGALKCPFPEEWAGKPAEELVRLTGIRTLRFCHNNRFLVAADTKEDARAACLLALRLAEERKVRE